MSVETAFARFAARVGGVLDEQLEALATMFALTPFERDLIGLCAVVEADPALAAECADAHGDRARPWVSFGLALARLELPHWSALSPGRPLRYWRLVSADPQPTLTTGRVAIDERVLHFLLGSDHLDARLEDVVVDAGAQLGELSPSQAELVARLVRQCRDLHERGRWPQVQLVGGSRSTTRAVAQRACAELGWRLRCSSDQSLDRELKRIWEREAALSGSALLIEVDDAESADSRQGVARFAAGLQGALMIGTRDPVPGLESALLHQVERPHPRERRQLWTEALGNRAAECNGLIERLGDQFDLDVEALHGATEDALASTASGSELGNSLWRACRERSRRRLDDLAQRIEPVATIDDVVLPDAQREILRQIVAQVRQRGVVYERWGFAAKSGRGLGITALFAGASGTGKTMAAEALALELELDLYRIDLSAVVSKYIGETEKNLRRVFDAAESGGAVLLFDEADALFGKRTEVKDSHDRYANIEVSYLLQRMESYRGLAILTTNLKDSVDPAFLRRLRFVVTFPFPDADARAEIWRRIFPDAVPTDELVPAKLAKLAIAGGNIRNIALSAAFLAADETAPVRMDHLLAAARSEYAKIERPLTSGELDGWQ